MTYLLHKLRNLSQALCRNCGKKPHSKLFALSERFLHKTNGPTRTKHRQCSFPQWYTLREIPRGAAGDHPTSSALYHIAYRDALHAIFHNDLSNFPPRRM
jgi:hypothetical protein